MFDAVLLERPMHGDRLEVHPLLAAPALLYKLAKRAFRHQTTRIVHWNRRTFQAVLRRGETSAAKHSYWDRLHGVLAL